MGAAKTIAAEVSSFNFRWHQNVGFLYSRDEPGGYPFTGQAVPGAEVA